ncbi:MAG TPA: hypothetical protein VFB34_00795 [Chloroflexota bacterium]|nr:hypothetical protein [Chloroflexota bacterium]
MPRVRQADDAEPDDILTVLEPDQLVEARRRPFGLRRLSKRARLVMWALRVYTLLMMVVVLYDVVRLILGG